MIHQGNQLSGTKPVIVQTNTILSWILMGTNKACWVFPILHFLLKLSLFAAFLTEKIWWVGDVLRVDGMKPASIRSWRILSLSLLFIIIVINIIIIIRSWRIPSQLRSWCARSVLVDIHYQSLIWPEKKKVRKKLLSA